MDEKLVALDSCHPVIAGEGYPMILFPIKWVVQQSLELGFSK